jgi:hypothetical protein
LLASILLLAGSLEAATLLQRDEALAQLRGVATLDPQDQLQQLAIAGDATATLALLKETAQRTDWPPALRDRAVYEFTQSLRSLPRSSIAPEVMGWLQAYPPQALVPHEDHADGWVPLFNVRAAAIGVENEWQGEQAVLDGLAMLASQPRALVDAWLQASHPALHLGYLQALQQASPATLQDIGKHARRQLAQHPELTELAGQAALLAHDYASLGEVLALGGGAALAPLMRQCALELAPEINGALLDSTLALGHENNAALAIAELAPTAAALPHTQQLLVAQLGNPELGATAALALISMASDDSLQQLQQMAQDERSIATRHARLVLDAHASARELQR